MLEQISGPLRFATWAVIVAALPLLLICAVAIGFAVVACPFTWACPLFGGWR